MIKRENLIFYDVACLLRLMDERTSYVHVLSASFGPWIKERGILLRSVS